VEARAGAGGVEDGALAVLRVEADGRAAVDADQALAEQGRVRRASRMLSMPIGPKLLASAQPEMNAPLGTIVPVISWIEPGPPMLPT